MSDGSGRRFKLMFWPTVFTVPALIILVLLGNWQVHRLAWKQDLLHRIETNMTADPVSFPAAGFNPQNWEYRRVTVSGTFDHAHEQYLFARGPRGGIGYQVITPLDRPHKMTVLVNRGWVPDSRLDPATRSAGQVKGPVTITGFIRLDGRSNIFTPAGEPANKIWYVRDIKGFAKNLGLQIGQDVAPVMVDADSTPNPGGLPVGGQTNVDIPNHHLDYALTWYGLALTLLVIYIVYHWRAVKPRAGQ